MTRTVLRIVLQFGSIVLLARLLLPSDYGLLAIVLVVVGIGEIVRDFGLSTAAIRAPELPPPLRDALFWINTAIGAVLCVLVIASSGLLARLFDRPELTGIACALAATFVSYGVTELLHCYGFLAVFITALTFRHSHREHGFHDEMHAFIEQVERVTMMALLLIFGGALAGGILSGIGWYEWVFAGMLVLVIRPLAGIIGLARSSLAMRDHRRNVNQSKSFHVAVDLAGHLLLLGGHLNLGEERILGLKLLRLPEVVEK